MQSQVISTRMHWIVCSGEKVAEEQRRGGGRMAGIKTGMSGEWITRIRKRREEEEEEEKKEIREERRDKMEGGRWMTQTQYLLLCFSDLNSLSCSVSYKCCHSHTI